MKSNILYPYQNLSLQDIPGEIWKDIPGLEEYCRVSDKGRIKMLARTIYRKRNGSIFRKERIVKQIVTSKKTKLRKVINYQLYFSVSIDHIIYRMSVPRVVYDVFVRPLKSFNEKILVSHIDDNPFNNYVENLYVQTHQELGKRNICTGKTKVPDVTKFSKKLWKKIRKASSKPVSQYSLDGNFIKYYESIKQAADYLQISPTSIGKVVRGDSQQAGGYIWKEGKSTKKIPAVTSVHQTIRPVSQYTLEGDYITSYSSLSEASQKLGILSSGISNCINGKAVSSGGYLWRSGYVTEKIKPYKPQNRRVHQYDLNGNYIASYPSIIEAERQTKANKKGIYTVLKNKKGTSGGSFWKEE